MSKLNEIRRLRLRPSQIERVQRDQIKVRIGLPGMAWAGLAVFVIFLTIFLVLLMDGRNVVLRGNSAVGGNGADVPHSRIIAAFEQLARNPMANATASKASATVGDKGLKVLQYIRAHRVLDEMDRAREGLQALAELREGSLVVGTSDTLAYYLLPPAIAAFRARYPGVELRLDNRPSPATAERVAERVVDVGVVTLPLPAGLRAGGKPAAAMSATAQGHSATVLMPMEGRAAGRSAAISLCHGVVRCKSASVTVYPAIRQPWEVHGRWLTAMATVRELAVISRRHRIMF